MKINPKELFYISRPRFWMYVLGTFLVGMIASGTPFQYDFLTNVLLVVFSIFFTFPANLFIYGVNDIYDYQTDILNEKKVGYEEVLQPEKHQFLWKVIGGVLLPVLPLFFVMGMQASLALIVFLFAGFFYSAKPIRAKSKPPLDILFSSIIYVCPAVIGYFITGKTTIDWVPVLGGIIWTSGMQTYSAIPDIKADSDAGIKTLATKLGAQNALIFCLLAYLFSSIIGYFYVGYIAIFFGSIYVAIVLLSMFNRKKLFKYYTYFPLVNIISGAVLFFFLFIEKVF